MKSELENNFYPFYKVISINNDINPSVDILIESIDRFSFGEDEDDQKLIGKTNGEEKIKRLPPNNYCFIKADNILDESNQKFKDLNKIINNILDIKLLNEENNNKGKICGIFNKEDFELKIDNKKKHKNNQLNDSFEKNYSNPLKNFLDDEDDKIPENNNNNIIKDLPIPKNEINKKEKEEKIDKDKEEKFENKNIINEINNDINNDKNENEKENKIIENEKESELNKDKDKDKDKNNNNEINVNNSNSNIKINNYDTDDDKENEQKIKEIKNSDTEIPFIGDLLPFKNKEKEPISAINSQKIQKLNIDNENNQNKNIDLPINKNNIENIKINNINNIDILDNDGYQSPRLGGNFVEEEKEEIKKIDEEIKNINSNNNNEDKEDKIIIEEENKLNDDINLNNNEQQLNLPLSLNMDSPFINPNNSIDSSKNHLNKIINQEKKSEDSITNINLNLDNKENKDFKDNTDNTDNKENKDKKFNKDEKDDKDNKDEKDDKDNNINKKKEKDLNKNLAELKANSFIIKNTSSKVDKDNDSEEKNKKILELTQKLEKSEKNAQIIKEKNEKLLEEINMFKNLQTIEQKKPPNSGKNSRSDTPKRHIIKKRCFTPTLSKTNKIYNKIQAPAPYHKRSNSYNKIKINNNQFNENRLYIDYIPPRQKTYKELHGRESNRRKENKYKQIKNNNEKIYGNYINRNTIYLTGTNSKYIKSPYLCNNMNYTGISYSNGFNNNYINHNNSYSNSNYLYMNNSSQSFYVNNNIINNIDDNYRNIYQRQVMQMPPNEQPLFYETKSNISMNHNNNSIYNQLIYNNNNKNYNSENKFNRNNNKEKNNKYNQEISFNNSNQNLSLNNNVNSKNNNTKKRNKNKLLDFKDFQIIFDEPLTKEKSDNKHLTKNTNNNDSKNNINNNSNKIRDNKNYSNNNYNLINYREYSNYKMNELNKNNNLNNNKINLENKNNKEKFEKGNEDKKIEKKDLKTSNENNFNIKKNNKNIPNMKTKNNNINNINNLIDNDDSKEFKKNNFWNEKIDNSPKNNIKNNEDKEFDIIKDDINLNDAKIMENIINKNKGDYMFPFYLINRNELFFNILSYTNNEKSKKKNK